MPKKSSMFYDAQKELISSLLMDSEKINDVLEIITVEDVEEPSFAVILEAMSEITRAEENIDIFSVGRNLENKGKLKEAGGWDELYRLRNLGTNFLANSSPLLKAKIVKDYSTKKNLKDLFEESLADFEEDSGKLIIDAVSDLQSTLNENILKYSDSSTMDRYGENDEEYVDLLEKRRQNYEENKDKTQGLQGIPSLIPKLNDVTTGWLPGQLIVVAARTSIGKSVFAINCATTAAEAGCSTLFFSLEMEKEDIYDRIVSSRTDISLEKLKNGQLDNDEFNIVKKELKKAKSSQKLYFDTDSKQTIDSIRAKALRQAASTGLDMIIVDYLQLVTPSGRFGNRQEAVADLSRNMKILAKQLGVPIMILSQLNREKKDEDDTPTLDNIRESGAIAQDADIVILLHRDMKSDERDVLANTLVIVAKNRNGESNKYIACHSDLAYARFTQIKTGMDVDKENEDRDNVVELENAENDGNSDNLDEEEYVLDDDNMDIDLDDFEDAEF